MAAGNAGFPHPNKFQFFFAGHGTYTFNVPIHVSLVFVTGSGAGAAGAGNPSGAGAGSGSGSGEYCVRQPCPCVAGGTITIVLGQGGAATSLQTQFVSPGGSTTVTPVGISGYSIFLQGGLGTGATPLLPGQGGGAGGANQLGGNSDGLLGNQEGSFHWGGSSGGCSDTNLGLTRSNTGGPCQGFPGGLGGVCNGSVRSGGGGGASVFGPGGLGGDSNGPGNAPPAGSWGAGGGGAGGGASTQLSGAGLDGGVIIEWVDYT